MLEIYPYIVVGQHAFRGFECAMERAIAKTVREYYNNVPIPSRWPSHAGPELRPVAIKEVWND